MNVKGPTVTDATPRETVGRAIAESAPNEPWDAMPEQDREHFRIAADAAMEATRTATNRASEGELREALERISALRPSHANANTAMDLHLTVKAIADSALTREQAGGAPNA